MGAVMDAGKQHAPDAEAHLPAADKAAVKEDSSASAWQPKQIAAKVRVATANDARGQSYFSCIFWSRKASQLAIPCRHDLMLPVACVGG